MNDARIPPQVVVFDLGKVLLDFDFGRAAAALAARSVRNAEEIRVALDQSPLLHRYETGLMSSDEFFLAVSRAVGYSGSNEEFDLSFGDIFTEIPAMIDMHEGLRRLGISTYIFSNTNELAVRWIRKVYPFFTEFSGYVFSFEHGAMKPNAKLYDVVEAMTNRRGSEILYLDDRQENIDAGSARGWQTICHQDPAQSIQRVSKFFRLNRKN